MKGIARQNGPGRHLRRPGPQARRYRGLCGLVAGLAVALVAASSASAGTSRPFDSSLATSLPDGAPDALAVDQANGDIYAAQADFSGAGDNRVFRFDSSGAPKDFTAGPAAGTNVLDLDLSIVRGGIAIDSSGGPLDGALYVTAGDEVRAFTTEGAPLGVLDGSGSAAGPFGQDPCALAVDQADGSLYVSVSLTDFGHAVLRYLPNAPAGPLTDSDYAITGLRHADAACALSADAGNVYGTADDNDGRRVRRFAASSFTPAIPAAPQTAPIDGGVVALAVDPGTGELYLHKGYRVTVRDAAGARLYDFSRAAYHGAQSRAVAVKSASVGPAEKAYVADFRDAEIDVFGVPQQVPTFTYPELAAFGPDGTSAGSFANGGQIQLAVDQATRRLYALDTGVPGIYGLDASAPLSYTQLPGFGPRTTAATGFAPGLAADPLSGRVFLASRSTDLVYGFDLAGSPLGPPFPLDPAADPGGPAGSPTDPCDAAVDSAGDLWVSNAATDRVLHYSSTGAFEGAIDTAGQGAPCGLAFDSDDDLYVSMGAGGGVWHYTAASGYTVAIRITATPGSFGAVPIAVDPATDRLYVSNRELVTGANDSVVGWVDIYDSSGNLLDEFITGSGSTSSPTGVAVDGTNGYLYLGDATTDRIRVFGPGVLLPELAMGAPSSVSNTAATLNGTVNTQGVSLIDCRFEYVTLEAFRLTGFSDLSSGGTAACDPNAASIPADLDSHAVSAAISGLERHTPYRLRLVAANADGEGATDPGALTTAGPPAVETAGSMIRTATTATLTGRVNPRGSATSFHFEYGDQGPCASNPCAATPPQPVGAGQEIRLVEQEVVGLQPDTTYHYRLVADNGNPDGPTSGEDRTITTRFSDDPPSHGDFPGPPSSDRAWELISVPDASGNPADNAHGFSSDGDHALYQLKGGAPEFDYQALILSERTAGGWSSRQLTPPRASVAGNAWGLHAPIPAEDLDRALALNEDSVDASRADVWLLSSDAPGVRLLEPRPPVVSLHQIGLSADGSRAVGLYRGAVIDPAYPAAAAEGNLYDLGSDPPKLISVLPNDTPGCIGNSAFNKVPSPSTGWISDDGNRLYFLSTGTPPACTGTPRLYARDLAAESTTLVSGPALSGGECDPGFLRATDEAIFFWTPTRLVSEDRAPQGCSDDGDVYRYDLATSELDCVTCLFPGLSADVFADPNADAQSGAPGDVGISADGSRAYFKTKAPLLAGAPDNEWSAYRLEIDTGDLALVGPVGSSTNVGISADEGSALSADGSILLFTSDHPGLDPVGGPTNADTEQYYVYDDRTHSLTCVSCPPDGSAPSAPVRDFLLPSRDFPQANVTPVSDDGNTVAFAAPSPLVPEDENTAMPGQDPGIGADIYEFRDGRPQLITDGETSWPPGLFSEPQVNGISPSGENVYFTAAARYTPDAVDGVNRLYTARVGGGIDFPPPGLPPCDLNSGACEGPGSIAPDLPGAGTAVFEGLGNQPPRPQTRCPRGKRKVTRRGTTRCVPRRRQRGGKKSKRNAQNHRRANR
jgi:DNA-binding beta-propeller fold protein YncE